VLENRLRKPKRLMELAFYLAQGVAGRLADAASTYLCLSLGLQELNPRVIPLLARPTLFLALQALSGATLGLLAYAAVRVSKAQAGKAPPEWRKRIELMGKGAALAVAAINWFPVPWNLLQAILALTVR